jgi:hypothetical protein
MDGSIVSDLAQFNCEQTIVEKTSAKIRKFLYELAEGTSDYRSLHSLTEQVQSAEIFQKAGCVTL